jgi:hypothetical protein
VFEGGVHVSEHNSRGDVPMRRLAALGSNPGGVGEARKGRECWKIGSRILEGARVADFGFERAV